MYYLLMEKFNNYQNRIIKRYDTVQEYIDYCTTESNNYSYNSTIKTNFNKRDNIVSTHIFNDNLNPDYVIWIDETTGNIVSRWFVINYNHTSGNQYLATLKHDSIADHYYSIINSPAFIEKGHVNNDDPAVFNLENMTLNQIKTEEATIEDKSMCAWIIGYLATNHTSLTNSTFTYKDQYDLFVNSTFAEWSYSQYCDGRALSVPYKGPSAYGTSTGIRFSLNTTDLMPMEFLFNSRLSQTARKFIFDYWKVTKNSTIDELANANFLEVLSIDWDTCIDKIIQDNPSVYIQYDIFDYFTSINGKVIKFTDGYYRINLISDPAGTESDWVYYNSGNLYNYLYPKVENYVLSKDDSITQVERYPVAHKLVKNNFHITYQQITDVEGTYKYTMDSTQLNNLIDAPYKMFAIPYRVHEDIDYSFNNVEINNKLSLNWAIDICKKLGANVYDIQLLPFFPDEENCYNVIHYESYVATGVEVTYDKTVTEGIDVVYLRGANDEIVDFAYFFEYSSFESNPVAYSMNLNLYDRKFYDYKIENQTRLYRLCSPNYASVFEFSPVKNGGNILNYRAYCTYKPYNPYVNLAPNFALLYGRDFKDNRGLILSGDFSLPIINSAWTNYQLSNKNYQLAFDRQIQNMEFNYLWERRGNIANFMSGTMQGATMGAMTGGQVGGPYGAVAGAVIGGSASAFGGALDLMKQSQSFSEAKDYAYDNYGYQLANIKALPNTLNKVSSLTANSKYFPYLEHYSCTPEEVEALRNKIKYNGMSIGRIGRIYDFINNDAEADYTFIKCQLIRNESIPCSGNQMLDIYNELDKGVFIK